MVATRCINSSIPKDLRLAVLPKAVRDAFLRTTSMNFFSSGSWYLAGGTALALQVGHRQSVDLDFFTRRKTFDEKRAAEEISEGMNWRTTSIDRGTLYGEFCGAKMSLIAYPFFKPAESMRQVGTVSLLKPTDIAAMKIIAISQRGRKRDFVDLYWLSMHVQPLEESIKRAEKQYTVSQNLSHLLKSLVYFADAEDDPMPKVFFDTSWKKVEKYFREEVSNITKIIVGLK